MGISENFKSQLNPQSIILISDSPSRQLALKALLRIALGEKSILVADGYQMVIDSLDAETLGKALVVIDNWSIGTKLEKGCRILREKAPDVHCVVLVKQENNPENCFFPGVDAVLEGSFSGGQFVETIQKIIEVDGMG